MLHSDSSGWGEEGGFHLRRWSPISFSKHYQLFNTDSSLNRGGGRGWFDLLFPMLLNRPMIGLILFGLVFKSVFLYFRLDNALKYIVHKDSSESLIVLLMGINIIIS